MHLIRAALAVALASLAPLAARAEAPATSAPVLGRVVTLTASDIVRLGLQTAPLKSASYAPHVHGYGVVMDLTELAQVDSALVTAQAAAQQSQADVHRYRALFAQGGAISRQILDTAEKQAATDQAQLLLAERNEFVQFGQQAPWLGSHPDKSVLQQLTAGHVVLVKATFPLDTLGAAHPTEVSVSHLSAQQDQPGWTTKQIWSGPADPTIPGRSFFALVRGSDLQPGEHALVSAPVGATIDGVQVPSGAVVFSEAKAWCYLQIAPGSYQRMQIDLGHPLAGGYFVAAKPGSLVVVRGTGLLLARELGAAMLLRY
jgi:hypothetical protein